MFYGCSKLNYVKALFTTNPHASNQYPYTFDWLRGVSSTGTFVMSKDADWYVTGTHGILSGSGTYGIPSGWTVKTE